MKRLNKPILYVFFLLGIYTLTSCTAQNTQTDVARFEKQLKAGSVQLVDVRTTEEFIEGHLQGAINYDVNGNEFEHQIQKLDKNKTVMVYCRSGKRSAHAATILRKKGYTVVDLAGGISAWEASGKPVVQ